MKDEEKKTTKKKPTAKKTTTKKPTAKTAAVKKPAAKKAVQKKAPAKKPVEAAKPEVKKEPVVKEEPKKEEVKTARPSNKKFIIVLICIVCVAIAGGIILALSLTGKIGDKKTKDTTTIKVGKEKVKITKSEAQKVELDTYDNSLVSFKYPKGWKVEVAPFDYIHYSFKVYDPENPDYMFMFGMKFEGFNKSQAAKNWQKKYYPSNLFAKLPVINPQTTEGFYKVWNETASYVNKYDAKSEYLPKFKEFNIIEKLGKNQIGGDILRASYKNTSGKTVQGLFTAAVYSAGSYYVNSNVFNLTSKKIDVFPLNVYNIIFMTAPDEEFVNWQSVLDNCLATIEFSQDFINGFNKEENQVMKTIQANQRVYDQISDMIMDSWEKRSASYDRISQKQSDATLGYDRVYDTTTGDIYKADLDFMDHDWNGKYERVTDDMYTKPITGYIEKVN